MKKTQKSKLRYNFISLLILCLFLFNTGCGLEEYIIIEEPSGTNWTPTSTSTYEDKYFEFRTNERNSDFFVGTNIYYKIFNSSSSLDYSSIVSLANDEDKKSTATTSMINKGYKLLRNDREASSSCLIPKNQDKLSQTVKIRLTDYHKMDDWASGIYIDDVYIGKPIRCLSSGNYSFNFGITGENNPLPDDSTDSSEKDFNSSKSNGTWYVSMFAVSMGLDPNVSPVYSAPLYLGTVAIVETEDGN